jgi:RNA polymerase sigma-70 factor (ECF subfamily)
VARFISAYEAADLDALVALLTDDAFVSMPPLPFEYNGRDAVASFCASLFGSGRRVDLVRTRANGQPALGTYLRVPVGDRRATGLLVLTLASGRIRAMTRFETTVLPWFGLPPSLPSQ